MKSFLIVFFSCLLMSAGCESTSNAAPDDKTSTEPAEKTETSASNVVIGTDYSDKDEIADISGPMTISGTITAANSYEGKYIKLYETEGKDIFVLDSSKVSKGAFSMSPKKVKIGMHKLGFESFKLGELILNPNEKNITVSGSAPSIDRSLRVTGSQENNAYTEYKIEKNKYDAGLKQIRGMKASREVKMDLIYKKDAEFKVIQEALADNYPDTYFAKMVRRWQSPSRFDKASYWNDIDFSDASLIRSMVLNDRIQDYMRAHGRGDKEGNDGFLDAVDVVFTKSKDGENDDVANFMLYTMMEGFYTSGMKEASTYIIENYIYGDDCGNTEISEVLKGKGASLRSLVKGQTPADFTIADENGKMVNLRTVAAKNDLTLILFWASWCHKCEQEMPVIKKIYDANKAKGFEIIGVSVDQTKPAWISGIKAKQCDWINVSQLEGWQSQVAKDYRISSTPVMFLVDSEGKLVLTPDEINRAFKLEKWMSENYK